MIVKREEGHEDEILLSIRYSFEDKKSRDLLCRKLESNNISFIKSNPSMFSKKYIVRLDDLETFFFDPNILLFIHRDLNIKKEDFDFFLGISSEYQMGGFTVPDHVVEYIRVLGGSVEISYAYCGYTSIDDLSDEETR